MLWTTHEGIAHETLYDGAGAPAAYVRHHQGKWDICGTDHSPVAVVRESEPCKLTIDDQHSTGEADISLADTAPALLPPRAQTLALQWGGKALRIEQSPRRVFSVYSGKQEIGHISGLLCGRARIDLPDSFSAPQAAVLLVLAMRMLHEDDVDIV